MKPFPYYLFANSKRAFALASTLVLTACGGSDSSSTPDTTAPDITLNGDTEITQAMVRNIKRWEPLRWMKQMEVLMSPYQDL